MANYIANADVVLYDDPLQVMENIAETRDLLGEHLGDQGGMNVTVLGITATCGQGFTTGSASNSSTMNPSKPETGPCVACPIGSYKETMDNSPCAECPNYASTSVEGTVNASMCECGVGYMRVNKSAAVGPIDDQACVSANQFVSVEDAQAAAQGISTAVGAVVATNVMVAVSTTVASSVSSAVAASSAGAAGGAGGGVAAETGSAGGASSASTVTLITQVQVWSDPVRPCLQAVYVCRRLVVVISWHVYLPVLAPGRKNWRVCGLAEPFSVFRWLQMGQMFSLLISPTQSLHLSLHPSLFPPDCPPSLLIYLHLLSLLSCCLPWLS